MSDAVLHNCSQVNDNPAMNRDYRQAKESLSHVYWIGGGAAAGKTTISRRLCQEFGYRRWSGDGHWIEHWQTATPETNPDKAVFLICTDDFMRETWKLRTTEGSPGFLPILRQQLDTCSDPQYALDNFIESNIIENHFVAEDCRRQGVPVVVTGGSMSLDDAYASVRSHFRLDDREPGHRGPTRFPRAF